MDDLISRQAAIVALYEYWSGCSFEGSGQYIADKSEDVLNELPYIQPTHTTPSNTLDALDCISRQAAINKFEPWLKVEGYSEGELNMLKAVLYELRFIPSIQPRTEKWNNHTVACLLADMFGDTCACNFNGIDEWLPQKCELVDSCPNTVGVACWEQFLTHREDMREGD